MEHLNPCATLYFGVIPLSNPFGNRSLISLNQKTIHIYLWFFCLKNSRWNTTESQNHCFLCNQLKIIISSIEFLCCWLCQYGLFLLLFQVQNVDLLHSLYLYEILVDVPNKPKMIGLNDDYIKSQCVEAIISQQFDVGFVQKFRQQTFHGHF